MIKQALKLSLYLILSLPALARAEDTPLPRYDVEIIIFEDAHARYLNSETWPQKPESAEDESRQKMEAEADIDLDQLSLSELQSADIENIPPTILNDEYQRIDQSSEYRVLQYSAWRQAGLNREKAFEVSLQDLENVHQGESENHISGTLKLVLARYLHIFGKLDYSRPTPASARTSTMTDAESMPADRQTAGGVTLSEPILTESLAIDRTHFPVEFRRRMRSKELHYIDHPLVGILIQVNPVKKADSAETPAVQDE